MSSLEPYAAMRPQARLDLVELATYIANDSIDAAARLLDKSEETLGFLANNPQTGAIYPTKNPRLSELRVFQIREFPNHLAFCIERHHGIEVVRILHGARNLDSVLNLE
ncbi:MAG: type II toxin-antitoxin system RelE/ParE family toxin [Bythopirellula sp.]|nr:type II toxin-antitoxin system RelE/ParE family toxin [Bythopirellula sp.]